MKTLKNDISQEKRFIARQDKEGKYKVRNFKKKGKTRNLHMQVFD